VASSGPYANHLHHTPVLQTDNHASTPSLNFLRAWCSSWRPTNSVKALKSNHCCYNNNHQTATFSRLTWLIQFPQSSSSICFRREPLAISKTGSLWTRHPSSVIALTKLQSTHLNRIIHRLHPFSSTIGFPGEACHSFVPVHCSCNVNTLGDRYFVQLYVAEKQKSVYSWTTVYIEMTSGCSNLWNTENLLTCLCIVDLLMCWYKSKANDISWKRFAAQIRCRRSPSGVSTNTLCDGSTLHSSSNRMSRMFMPPIIIRMKLGSLARSTSWKSGHCKNHSSTNTKSWSIYQCTSTSKNKISIRSSKKTSNVNCLCHYWWQHYFHCYFVCMSVCEPHYTKSYGCIFMKFGNRKVTDQRRVDYIILEG